MPQFVIEAEHSPDLCPTSNAKTRKIMAEGMPMLPAMAAGMGITIITLNVFGPEHRIIGVVEAGDIATVRDFVMQAGLVQWNTVKVNATWTPEEALERANKLEPIF